MISIIVAIANNGVIGKDNDLPWHYPKDLQYFRKQTLNKTIVMGTNTFKSIIDRSGKPLPKRKSIVATRNKAFTYENVDVINDLKSFLKQDHTEEVFIIGGKQIYECALPYAKRLYITHIEKDYIGDTYFPEIDYTKYKLISEHQDGILRFCIYEKV